MLRIIYGLPGSKKSEVLYSLIRENLINGTGALLVVPEQKALTSEKRIYELTSSESLLGLEVLNFDKLCETVFRKCGFLAHKYITESTKKLLLSRTLADLSGALTEYYGRYDDEAYVSQMLTQITELKNARITPTLLASAQKSIASLNDTKHERLSRKLIDLALIYASYNALITDVGTDTSDAMTKAAELIEKYDPFKGQSVYFDSFNGFTAQEYEIIRALLSHGIDVTVTLTHPGKSASEVFLFTDETKSSLLRVAERAGTNVEHIISDDGSLYANRSIEYLSKSFTVAGEIKSELDGDGVTIISCSDVFDECDTCAANIARSVREGNRYKDITVVVRDLESYKGILDTSFERYGIPYFLSDKTDISQKSLIRFILTALDIARTLPKYSDVITYLRCGLTDLLEYESDLIEQYASTWKISGKIWYGDDGFTMNPRGYIPLSSDDADKLSEINRLRTKIVTPIINLRDKLKECKCVNDFSRAIFDFVSDSKVKEKLAERYERMLSENERVLAAEEASLWRAFCDCLDELDKALGTHECNAEEYVKLFKMVLSDTDIGTIPQSADSVTVTDATMLRSDNVKHAFLLGCEDGIFPQSTSVPGLLSLEDRRTLTEHRLEDIAFDPVSEASRELFLFYCAACLPSEKLTLSYSRKGISNDELFPSSALLRIAAAFENISISSSDIDVCDRITGTESLIEHIPYLSDKLSKASVELLFEKNKEARKKQAILSKPLANPDERLSKDAVDIAFPGDLNISQSATDAYSKCPFSFQCKYSLKLREKASDSIQKNDIGTLVHSVLDDFLQRELNDYLEDGVIDTEAITTKIYEITNARSRLLLEFAPEEKKARVEHLLKRVSQITALSAINLAQEALQSGFKSTFFEFPISTNGALSPIKLLLDDNSFLVLGGIADRVDTMLKGDKLYVRVADYKTGSRTFSLESVRAGLSLQLLIYLFSIWENADEKFKRAAGAVEDCEIIPAGAEYIMTMPGSVAGTNDSEALSEALSKAFKRSGIYLADSEIINEMDKGFSGRFVPVSVKMNDTKQAVLRSLEELNELKDELSVILTEIGNGIKSGNAAITPLKEKLLDTDACEYCHLKPVCKNAGNRLDTAIEQ